MYITDDEFERIWNNTRDFIRRIEQEIWYNIPEDQRIFEQYKRGESISVSELGEEWYSFIKSTADRGVEIHRFRVFDVPLPLYQKYEIDWGYLVGNQYGQQTWAIRRELYNSILHEMDFNGTDVWSFDNLTFLKVEYTEQLDFLGEVVIQDKQETSQAKALLEAIENRSVSLSDFLESVGHDTSMYDHVLF